MSSKPIYLDHAAATPLDPRVLEAMQPYLKDQFYNPSSLYGGAREVREAVEGARHRVAQVLGAKKTEIIFTAGGTESVNLALFGVMRSISPVIPYRKHSASDRGSSGLNLIATSIEHEAVLACLPSIEHEGYKVAVVPVKSDGLIDVNKLIDAIDDSTVLVSVMYANNEIGTIQPIADIAKAIALIRQKRADRGVTLPLFLHSDACQAGGQLDLHVSRLGVDLLTLNGSKIYGPKQVGCLYVRTGTPLAPLVHGGGQERGMRSGTEDVAGIIGFAKALELAQSDRETEVERLSGLRDNLLKDLKSAIPDLITNGHPTKRLANNLNITIPGIDGEAAVLYLDRQAIQASSGSACSTGSADPSHVLLALGRTHAQASASLRFTLGRSTSKQELDYLAATLPAIVARLRQLANVT